MQVVKKKKKMNERVACEQAAAWIASNSPFRLPARLSG